MGQKSRENIVESIVGRFFTSPKFVTWVSLLLGSNTETRTHKEPGSLSKERVDPNRASGERQSALLHAIKRFVNGDNLGHEILVIGVSYVFVFVGAWNDSLLGLAPSLGSRFAEILMASVLSLEILSRLLFSKERRIRFWVLIALDCTAVLTVAPMLKWFAFARLIRMVYACARVVSIVDRLACKSGNVLYLLILYPIIIPLAAAVLFAIEQHAPQSPVHNYVDALGVCFTFALSLGNVRPATTAGMVVCGTLFLLGIVCIGMITNCVSGRYGAMLPRESRQQER